MLKIIKPDSWRTVKPLTEVSIESDINGVISVADGRGREYVRSEMKNNLTFFTGGALGIHTVCLLDGAGKEFEALNFKVECETAIQDEGGRFKELLAMLHNTMNSFG